MKCPVCKTECHNDSVCPECGFEELNPTFLSKEEGDAWIENVVWPWRYRYWETLDEFEIKGTTLTKYYDSCEKTGNVRVPYGITSIGERAFHGCNYIFEVTLPASVKRIGLEAFSACPNLDFIEIPFGVEVIEKCAFDCELQDLFIPASVKKIEESFCPYADHISLDPRNEKYTIQSNCFIERTAGILLTVCDKEISNFEIPYGITRIGSDAFCGCYQMKEVIIPDSVKSIGDSAFQDCDSLELIVLPDGIKEIGERAFAGCNSLNNILLPESVKIIGNHAFRNTGISEITLPFGIEQLGEGFACDAKKIYAHSNAFFSVEQNILICLQNNSLVTVCDKTTREVIIPDTILRINGGAFCRCEYITNIDMPDNISHIGDGAFSWCERLQEISLPLNLKHIGVRAFSNCYALESIYFPDGIEIISSSAFSDCKNLFDIYIPDSIKSIGDYAFASCNSLTEVLFPKGLYSLGRGIFLECENLEKITFEVYFKDEYINDESWDDDWNLYSSILREYFPICWGFGDLL